MTLLVGRTDIGAFTATVFLGFGGGNGNVAGHTAIEDGTGNTLQTAVTSFTPATDIRYNIYEQVSGVGSIDLVASIDVLSAASPQNTVISPALAITAGNVYYLVCWPQATGEGDSWNSLSDPLIVSPDGIGSSGLTGSYAAPDDPLTPLTNEIDGEIYWNIDGVPDNARTVDSITGTLAPGETVTVNTTNLDATPTVQTATLGGESLTVNSWSATAVNLTIPDLISLDWGSSYDLVLTDDTGPATLAAQTLQERTGWDFLTYDGTVLDFATTESFKELIEAEHSDELFAGDQVYATQIVGVVYNDDSTANFPDGLVTGGQYYYRLAGVLSAIFSFTKSSVAGEPPIVTASQVFEIPENSTATFGPVAYTAEPVSVITGFTISDTDFTIDINGVMTPVAEFDFGVTQQLIREVTATDQNGTSPAVNITINITDVDESVLPTIEAISETLGVSAANNVDGGVVAAIVSTDADTTTLSGVDAASFRINGSNLEFTGVQGLGVLDADITVVNFDPDPGSMFQQEATAPVSVTIGTEPVITASQVFEILENSVTPFGPVIYTAEPDSTATDFTISGTDFTIDINGIITPVTGFAPAPSRQLVRQVVVTDQYGASASVSITISIPHVPTPIDRTQMLADAILYLPAENTLTDPMLSNIIDNVIDVQIPDGQTAPIDDVLFYSEDLCKVLKAAALLNRGRFAVDGATIKKEKVDDVEIEQFSGAARFAWGDYIKSLSDICPYLPGGGYKPVKAIGARINPSRAFIVDTCASTGTLYF
jgi:hypothetical protein